MPTVNALSARLAGLRLYLVLAALALALLVPGLAALPPIDRDEARFMQASKQMIESGDYTRIRFQSEPRDKKPPGAYWLQAGAAGTFSPADLTARWPYRLPSVIGVVLAVAATAATARRFSGDTAAMLAGAILASMPIVIVEGHLAKADALLLGLSAVCFLVLRTAYCQRAPVHPAALMSFWVSLGASVVIKGPVLAGLLGLTILTLAVVDRGGHWLKRLRPIIGLPMAAAVVAAWIETVGWNEAMRFVPAAIAQDLLPKLFGGVESHGAPPGAHAAAAILTLWPWSAMIPVAAVVAWRKRQQLDVRVCLAWITPAWLIAELVPTKLPHYILPCLPAVAILMADALSQTPQQLPRVLPWLARTATAALPLVLAIGISAAHMNGYLDVTAGLIIVMVLPFLVTALAVDPWLVLRRTPLVLSAVVAVYALLFQFILPGAKRLDIAGQLAAQIPQGTPVALAGFHEPSAVFRLGTGTQLTDTNAAIDHVIASPLAVAVIADDQWRDAERMAAAAGKMLLRTGRASGYNYAKGSAIDLSLVRTEP